MKKKYDKYIKKNLLFGKGKKNDDTYILSAFIPEFCHYTVENYKNCDNRDVNVLKVHIFNEEGKKKFIDFLTEYDKYKTDPRNKTEYNDEIIRNPEKFLYISIYASLSDPAGRYLLDLPTDMETDIINYKLDQKNGLIVNKKDINQIFIKNFYDQILTKEKERENDYNSLNSRNFGLINLLDLLQLETYSGCEYILLLPFSTVHNYNIDTNYYIKLGFRYILFPQEHEMHDGFMIIEKNVLINNIKDKIVNKYRNLFKTVQRKQNI